jgi:cellulose synthase/poly-beta-1,6-N-acetylglucosamine synthase-like glycosyltransferase
MTAAPPKAPDVPKARDVPDVPDVSVIIAAFSSARWDRLREAVGSARAQNRPAREVIVVVDHNEALLLRASRELPGATVIPNAGARGASGARNTGAAVSQGAVLAFLDDDARASRHWLESLLPHFADPVVVGAGGQVSPLWALSRPAWFPPEFDWTVGASYRGMPSTARPVRNVWSNNMAIRRSAFEAAGGFREDFGKVGTRSRPEDTDLCLRAAAVARQGIWVYEPAGIAGHWVPPERATIGYFLRRCFHEGRGKAGLAALDGHGQSTSAERHYTRHVLPRGIARGLREMVRGDGTGLLRSIAIATGFGVTAVGFAVGLLAGVLTQDGGR